MNKQQLAQLLALKNLPVAEVARRAPELMEALPVRDSGRLRREALARLSSSDEQVRDVVSGIDFSRPNVAEIQRDIGVALEAANLSPEIVRETLKKLKGISKFTPAASVDDRQPLNARPEAAELIERAKLLDVAAVARLDDATSDAVTAKIASTAVLDAGALKKLVADGVLDDRRAEELGFAATLYELTDGDKALAAAMRDAKPARLDGKPAASTLELARLNVQDWKEVFSSAAAALPQGVSVDRAAAAMADRLAALHPDAAFIARLPKAKAAGVITNLEALKDLFAANDRVAGTDFSELKTVGIPPAQVKQLEAAHAQIRAIALAYPGMKLAEVLDDPNQTAAAKAGIVERRINLIETLQQKLGDKNFLDIDLSPKSKDIASLNLASIGATNDEAPLIINTLKSFQRTYVLGGNVDAARQLLIQGFTSAKQVALQSKVEFRDKIKLDDLKSDKIWTAARSLFLDSTLTLGSVLDAWRDKNDGTRVSNVPPSTRNYLRDFAGFEALFGSLSFCDCAQCQSILGLPAYFVDLMHFIEEHILPQFGTRNNHPLHLRARRPDLWKLELTCANSETRIPTLEIVNEILENFIAQGRGFAGNLADRAAVWQATYEQALLDTANSILQPFHLPLTRVDAYLSKLETSRGEVARAMGAAVADRAAATLTLSPQQRTRIITPNTSLAFLSDLFGLAFAPQGGAGAIAAVDVQAVLPRTGLNRDELGQVISTAFVAAGGAAVVIRPRKRNADSVQNDVEFVEGLTADALDRVHRFARLWRQLSWTQWTIAELDHALTAVGDSTLGQTALEGLANIVDVQARLGMSVDDVCSLFADIPKAPAGSSFFDRLFNTYANSAADALPNAAVRFVHPALRAAAPAATDAWLPRLIGGLAIDLDGLGRLINYLAPHFFVGGAPVGFNPAAPNEADRSFTLTADNLSLLYRHARLARALHLGIDELFQLIALAGLPGRIGSLADLRQLLEFHDAWKASGRKLDEVAFAAGLTPRDPSAFPDPAALAADMVSGADEALTFKDTIFAVALGTSESASRAIFTANAALVTAAGEGRFRLADGIDLSTAVITVPAGVTMPLPPSGNQPVTDAAVRGVLRSYLPAEVLARRLAAALRVDPSKAIALAALIGKDLGAPALSAAFRGAAPINALRDLIKDMLPYAVAFANKVWDAAALDFLRQNQSLFGMTNAALTTSSLRALWSYVRLAERTTGPATDAPPVDPADIRLALQAFDATTSTFKPAVDAPLGRILNVSPGLILGVRAAIRLAAPAADALDALAKASLLANSLGIDGVTFSALAGTDYAGLSRAADALYAAYGARFADATQRASQLSALEAPVREKKRDALAAYLLYSINPRPFDSLDALYNHFLIDIQSGGCSTTSRVVGAISSLQLYVHRVVMNLEQDRRAPGDPLHVELNLPEEAAAEWPWRKNYRVWEANRKAAFLWPESYIEPDLRDDKTPLFEELETELLQTDINDQNVLDAYTKYLKGFEELASLTIAGAYHDVRTDGEEQTDILHLFGVASGDPPVYYYRTCENLSASARDPAKAAIWSPWRKIDVQITGRRVSPVVFLNRLHLFWVDFKTRPLNSIEDGKSTFVGYRHTMSMKFCTLRPDGAWTPPQSVLLPEDGYFGPGNGIIRDLLWGSVPWLDDKAHDEPIETYTLTGPNWDWVWLEPGRVGRQAVLSIRYRNFVEHGWVDLFERKVVSEWAELSPQTPPQVLCARGTKLYQGSPSYWVWSRTSLANLLIDESRLDVIDRELQLKGFYQSGLYAQQVATLPPGMRLLAVPGNVEDAIAQIGPDVILLQGSVTDDNSYVARRIGTTLGHEIARRLFVDGVDGLLSIESQRALREAPMPLSPIANLITDQTNAGTLDFKGPYGTYYRELFFHIPCLIANALNGRGNFAAAQRWYHYVFNPAATEVINIPQGATPEETARLQQDRVWRYLEFRNLDVAKLRDVFSDEAALAIYRSDPFNPHAVARVRLSAYQKNVVMKYLDNLMDWGDHLFAQFTMESVNEALMLYTMASDILGPRPQRLGNCGEGTIRPKTYEAIAPHLGVGEEILIEIETFLVGQRINRQPLKKLVKNPDPRLAAATLNRARRLSALRPRPRLTDSGLLVDSSAAGLAVAPSATIAGLAAAVAAGGEWTDEAISSSLQSADTGIFLGMSWKQSRIGSWSPKLSAAKTLSGIDQKLGRIGVSVEHNKFINWVGKFGWSIIRQLSPVFCIPVNKDLLSYWDRVEDRLYKIRHCMDIDGQVRELALTAPEIDPRLLVRMRAAGLSLEDVLAGGSGSLPPYRFLYLVDRAKGLAASLSGFGVALLSALEKKDAEEMNRLRLVHQQNLSRMTTQLKRSEIQAAEEALEALNRQRDAAAYRSEYYQGLFDQSRTGNEIAQSVARHSVSAIHLTEATIDGVAAILAAVPQVGSPFAMKYGGVELNTSMRRFGNAIHAAALGLEAVAASAGLEAGFDRRQDGWKHQRELADHDSKSLDRQIKAAEIRVEIARRSLTLHEEGIEQLDQALELMDGKFTNLGLYTWLSTRLRRLHRDAFQNALAIARLAEQAFRFERDDDTSVGLAATHWDASRSGLMAGEQLLVDLQSLERRFLETNYRPLEIDQTFPLSQIAPDALIQLRETGGCQFAIPELFINLYYAGVYNCKIRGVRLTIPCITGPYVNVSATLTLARSFIRRTPLPGQALSELPAQRSVSVATSTAQNDAGVFELSFRDERLLPFEGAGVISEWILSLPKAFPQFRYDTITEVVLSISYSAERDGALENRVESTNAALVGGLLNYLSTNAIAKVFSLRQDFSGAFTRLLRSPVGTAVSIEIDSQHFPIFVRNRNLVVDQALVLLRTRDGVVPAGFQLTVDGAAVAGFTKPGRPGELPGQALPAAFTGNIKSTHTVAIAAPGSLAAAAGATYPIDDQALLDILLYVRYRVS